MKPFTHTVICDKIFKDHKFYEHRQSTVSTQQYEKYQHEKIPHEYQAKKVPQFVEHKYSSSWNPLHKQYERKDRPYKQLHERRHKVKGCSDFHSDPLIITPNPSALNPSHRTPLPYNPSTTYKTSQQRKYLLPKDRQLSKPNKHYHSQLGISQQRLPVPNRKEKTLRNNSSLMRLSLDYSMERYERLNRSVEG